MTAAPDRPVYVAAHEGPALVGVPAGTIRRWASEASGDDGLPLLAARGLDAQGRPLYWKSDLEQLRDRPRRAGRGPRVDTERHEPNTAANGTAVSGPAR